MDRTLIETHEKTIPQVYYTRSDAVSVCGATFFIRTREDQCPVHNLGRGHAYQNVQYLDTGGARALTNSVRVATQE